MVSTLFLTGCALAGGNALDAAQQHVRSLVGDAACRSDADCATLPLGTQACGGPRGYTAYSVRATPDRAALARALDALSALQSGLPGREVSTCAVVPDPGASCVRAADAASGVCRLRPVPRSSLPRQ